MKKPFYKVLYVQVLFAIACGVPIGGELDYLDDGTIGAALRARRRL